MMRLHHLFSPLVLPLNPHETAIFRTGRAFAGHQAASAHERLPTATLVALWAFRCEQECERSASGV